MKMIDKEGNRRQENLPALAKIMERNAESYDRRQAGAVKRRAFTLCAYRLDAPRDSEEGEDEREDRLLSDGGRGAAVIRRMGRLPAWQREVRRVMEELTGVDRRIVEALACDRRPARAAKRAGTNRMRVYRLIAKLRVRLEPAYALYRMHED